MSQSKLRNLLYDPWNYLIWILTEERNHAAAVRRTKRMFTTENVQLSPPNSCRRAMNIVMVGAVRPSTIPLLF